MNDHNEPPADLAGFALITVAVALTMAIIAILWVL